MLLDPMYSYIEISHIEEELNYVLALRSEEEEININEWLEDNFYIQRIGD